MLNKKERLQLAQMQKSIEELEKAIEMNELRRLRAVETKYKEMTKDLQNVKLQVKTVKYVKAEGTVTIIYEAPAVILNVEDNGEIDFNQVFYSINMLNLISGEDMIKIQKELNKVKQNP